MIRKKSWSLSLKSLNFKDTKLRRVKSSLPTFPRIRSRERKLIQLSDLQLVFFPPRLAPCLSQRKNFLDKVKWTKKTLFKVTATEQCRRPQFDSWVGKIPWRRERLGYPLQYSGLKNSMDCIVLGVAKSWTGLSDFHFSLSLRQRLESRAQSGGQECS